jgi:lipid II:glycine glycyltransferase (peptidoglycan interpeptide bridge formation enzyme)
MALWYRRGSVASYHLAATSEEGYELECSYALVWHALEDLANQEIRWAHLGAGAGLATQERDGLAEFKQGWSTDTHTAWLCGRVFDRKVYDELAHQRGVREGDYFPLYRSGEFG